MSTSKIYIKTTTLSTCTLDIKTTIISRMRESKLVSVKI